MLNKMIAGSGIDVIEIARIQHVMDRFGGRFLDRVYLEAEQAYCLRKRNAAESFAARFAAKEAAAKALGTGISFGVNWLEIEVVREAERKAQPALSWPRRANCQAVGGCPLRPFAHPHRADCHGQRGARGRTVNRVNGTPQLEKCELRLKASGFS